MLLIGRDMSPFVRRVVISLEILGLPFERAEWATTDDKDKIAALYPMVRVPVAKLDDGEVLVDSAAILDWIDQEVGPQKALTPASGVPRRAVLQVCVITQSMLEKAIALLQERDLRPQEFVYSLKVEQRRDQMLAGLGMLEARAATGGWLIEDRLTQADVTLATGFEFAAFMIPDLATGAAFPNLAAHHERARSLPGFQETSLEKYRMTF
jgi:glutathione S-transferase